MLSDVLKNDQIPTDHFWIPQKIVLQRAQNIPFKKMDKDDVSTIWVSYICMLPSCFLFIFEGKHPLTIPASCESNIWWGASGEGLSWWVGAPCAFGGRGEERDGAKLLRFLRNSVGFFRVSSINCVKRLSVHVRWTYTGCCHTKAQWKWSYLSWVTKERACECQDHLSWARTLYAKPAGISATLNAFDD